MLQADRSIARTPAQITHAARKGVWRALQRMARQGGAHV